MATRKRKFIARRVHRRMRRYDGGMMLFSSMVDALSNYKIVDIRKRFAKLVQDDWFWQQLEKIKQLEENRNAAVTELNNYKKLKGK